MVQGVDECYVENCADELMFRWEPGDSKALFDLCGENYILFPETDDLDVCSCLENADAHVEMGMVCTQEDDTCRSHRCSVSCCIRYMPI